MNDKLYVLVRTDLSKSQQAVQAGHAVAEWAIHHRSNECCTWCNGTLVYLRVKNEAELKDWMARIKEAMDCAIYFTEPDLNDSITAVAAYGIGELVNRLQLL